MTGGSAKFNNQTAPRPGVLTRPGGRASGLPVLPSKSVPQGGAVFIPYNEAQDIGALRTADIQAGGTWPNHEWFMRQRGRNFGIQVSFALPDSEKLFSAPSLGQLTTEAAPFTIR